MSTLLLSDSMASKRKATDSPGTPSKKARIVLTLADKVKVIEAVNGGMSNVKVAKMFGCGRTQVGNIMANKNTIIEAYSNGSKATTKYLNPRHVLYPAIDSKVWDFYCDARSRDLPINGPLLKSEALDAAKELGIESFTASNGWLDSFAARHQLKFSNLHGESAGVNPEVCDQWKEHLPQLLQGYAMEDIWNVDETGINYRTVPKKSFIRKGETPHGTKAQTLKERFTALLCCSAMGEKEKLWVIGKSNHPKSMPKPKPTSFIYRNNSRAWVTTDIFVDFLNSFNNRMKKRGRHVLLLLDNCPSHPRIELSNVKLAFLPKNTTSHLQPLDLGIIAWLKMFYKRQLMSVIRNNMKDCSSIVDLAKKVTIYDAIVNIKDGWDQLSKETIKRCFVKAGIVMAAVPEPEPESNENEVEEGFDQWFADLLEVPWDEYLAFDDELDRENPPRAPNSAIDSMVQSPEDSEEPDNSTPPPTMEAAIDQLHEMRKLFVDNDTLFSLVNKLYAGAITQQVTTHIANKPKQSCITAFFAKRSDDCEN